MPRIDPDHLVPRSDAAWALKRPYYGLWVECWRYAAPGIDPYRSTGGHPEDGHQVMGSQGQPRHQHLFDSTLARDASELADSVIANTFPAGQQWAGMRAGPLLGGTGQGADTGMRQILDAIRTKTFDAIHASNFSLAATSMALDAIVSGTGCMKAGISADSSTLLDYDAVNQSEVAFERGPRGQVWAFFRKMRVPGSWMPVLWPQATRLPAPAMDGERGTEKKWAVLDATYYGPETGLWYYDVILRADDKGRTNVRIFERDYRVCPWIVWRYSLPPGDVQGRSPVMAALPDARTCNHAVRVRLQSASIRVAGMWTYKAEEVFNPRTVYPQSGAFLPVGSNDSANPTIRALELPGDPQMGELVLADTRESVDKTMLALALPDVKGTVHSPTEYMVREREHMEKKSMPYLRLVEEVGRPVLRSATYLLAEAGQLPELAEIQPAAPDGTPAPLMLDGRDVKVEFNTPMTQAQKLAVAETIVRWREYSQDPSDPTAWPSAVKTQDIPAKLNEAMQAPSELLYDEEERAERAEEQREAAMAQATPPEGAMAA